MLIKFVDHDGNEVWINPSKVCRVLTRKEHCSVYTEDGGMTWLAMPASMAISILEGRVLDRLVLTAKQVPVSPKPKKGTKK